MLLILNIDSATNIVLTSQYNTKKYNYIIQVPFPLWYFKIFMLWWYDGDDIESVKGIIRSQREGRILYCAYKCCKYCVFKEHKVLFKVFFRYYFKSISILCAHHQPKCIFFTTGKGEQTKNIHLVILQDFDTWYEYVSHLFLCNARKIRSSEIVYRYFYLYWKI